MAEIFVSDTTPIIEYFSKVFEKFDVLDKPTCTLSQYTISILDSVIHDHFTSPYRMTICSVTFIEIFEKWLRQDEDCARFYYDVFIPIKESPNIEIRGIDKEILENFVKIGNGIVKEHDKIILATAISLEAPLIAKDNEIADYQIKNKVIPKLIW